MLVLLLGPIALRDARGAAVQIGGPKRRAVLAALALEINQPLSVDRLLDLVWDGEPPAQAKAALHGHVAALRKVLPQELCLQTLPSGYRLTGDPSLVDSEVFADLWRRARATEDQDERSELLQQALGLWRGSTMADLPPSAFQREVAVRLYDVRLTVLTAWADCELRRGRIGRVIPVLEVAVLAEGLREDLVAALMRCLSHAGRQAEALEAYRRAATLLRTELGVHPGPELREALSRVLAGEPAAEPDRAAVPAAVAPPADPAGPTVGDAGPERLPRVDRLIGRACDSQWLDQALQPRPGEVPLAVVVGPAGVGKTSLAVDWAHRAAGRYPDGRLFADLRGFDEQDPKDPQDVLSGFLLALGVEPEQIPAGEQALAELFERLTRDRRLLLVLDNVRSAEDVRALLPAGEGCAVVVTSRIALLDLVAQDAAAWHLLQPLPVEEAVALLTATVGEARVAADPAAARRLAGLCDRLPLALRICASRLAVRPGWTVAQLVAEIEDEQTGLAGLDTFGGIGIRATLALTYRQLPPVSARLLALLGLCSGGRINPGVAATLLGCDLTLARFALGILAAYHLISEERPGRYTRSSLIRRYSTHLLAETVPTEERDEAFERLLDFGLAVSAAAAEPFAVFWWSVERPAGPQPPGLPSWETGVEEQEWYGEHEPELRFLIQEAARLGRAGHAWRLVENLSTLYWRSDPARHWLTTATIGLRAAEATGSPTAVGRLTGQLGLALTRAGRPEEGLPHLERAVATAMAAGDLRNLCAGQIRLAICGEALGRPPMACLAVWEAAVGCAQALDEPRVLAAVLRRCSRLARSCGDPESALRYVERALALGEVCTEEEHRWLVLERALVLELLGRPGEALELARGVLEPVLAMAQEAFPQRDQFVAEGGELVARLNHGPNRG
ncbi:DNA-binding SARP family transcriptional activator [Kitasatospora sp. GAS204A]|uniref:AfsR/SARP family transcriptional regulator n=1 Tax=unclassified Kitasatospora TaxID=2633591 RepID=UPI0024753CF1|nr:BTAD domain-containing putative transcriptional regulator [Kitasatospora sp. GAS204B]MDH6116803.1 DNA-binding SARP family transcriptional activator [Kitasatospora sp. GAS204B]